MITLEKGKYKLYRSNWGQGVLKPLQYPTPVAKPSCSRINIIISNIKGYNSLLATPINENNLESVYN